MELHGASWMSCHWCIYWNCFQIDFILKINNGYCIPFILLLKIEPDSWFFVFIKNKCFQMLTLRIIAEFLVCAVRCTLTPLSIRFLRSTRHAKQHKPFLCDLKKKKKTFHTMVHNPYLLHSNSMLNVHNITYGLQKWIIVNE